MIELRNYENQNSFNSIVANIMSKVWTAKDVANYLGVSVGHIYNLKTRRLIPYRKCHGILRFIPQEIIDWINEGGF
jgi:predicted DNA-binding transcriptional regulator AlpA